MTMSTLRRVVAFGALAVALIIVADAKAQCCGQSAASFAQPATTFYQPTTSFYQPVAVQAYQPATSWYPGKWLGEFNRRIWGVNERYAVAAPVTYSAGYAPTYTAAYAPSYSVAYASPAVSYPAPASSACTTCAMPVVSPCDSCCGASTVTQASYESPGCANCGVAPASYDGPVSSSSTTSSTTTPPNTFVPNTPEEAPELSPTSEVPTSREQEAQRPASSETNSTNEGSVLERKAETGTGTPPASEVPPSETTPPANGAEGSSTYFEAPQLFDPSDHSARKSSAPVRTAVLHRPASQATLTATQISWQQAQQDAAGWMSAGK